MKQKRKSPIRHKVSSYTRKGKRVQGYTRGSGIKTTKKISKPTLGKPKGWTITLRYSKKPHDIEVVKVIATSYQRAVDEALEEKMDKRQPIEMEIVDPSIGEIVRWAGKRAVKYGKKAVVAGGKLAKSAAVAGGQFAKQKLKESYSEWEVKQWINQAYSPNKATRLVARAKLKNLRPDIYDVMDFSKS